MDQDSEDGLGRAIRSQIAFTPPQEADTNMARELYRAFERHSGRVLLADTASGREWTGAKLRDYCARLATGLATQVGLRPNDTVLTICDHNDREIATVLGVVMAGGALFGTSPSDGYAEVETLCSIVKPDVFVVSGRYHERALKLKQRVVGLSKAKIVWLDRPSDGTSKQTNGPLTNGRQREAAPEHERPFLVEELVGGQPADLDLVEAIVGKQIDAKQHTLTYMLTSGSTGRPKVVPSTHEELIYGLYSMISAATNPPGKAGLDANNNAVEPLCLLPVGPHHIVSGDLPLDHGAGLNTMFLSLWLGAKFVVMPSYDVDAFWQAVSDHKITTSISSTTFCYKLFSRLKQLIERGQTDRWQLDSFKFISCCGAKLAFIDLIEEVQRHYGHIQVTQAYGCTEIGFISMVHRDYCRSHLHSVGHLFPGVVAKVVDYERQSDVLGADERGELLVWARSKFKGYRCHPSDDPLQVYANCHDELGRFYRTGDQAHFDPQQRLYIHGRFKDTLCLMEDWKILPAELEDIINEHPLVAMSAVVGVPDPNLPGCHAPKAFIKLIDANSSECRQVALADEELAARLLADDKHFLSKHIYDFVASRTARPKHLTGGVRILEEFPRVGLLNKVDRKALRIMD